MIRNLFTIARRELIAYFLSPLAYLVLVAFLLVNGYHFFVIVRYLSDPLGPGGPPMQLFFGGNLFYWIIILFFLSAITMRLVAEEARNGTLETLLTTPVSEGEIIAGKYLGALVFYIFLWIPTLFYIAIVSALGNAPQDPGPIVSGYLGTLLAGVLFLAIGLFTSTLTRNQIVAAVLSFVFSCLFAIIGIFKNFVIDEGWRKLISYLDLFSHLGNFGKGIVDTRPVIYVFSLAAFFLFAAVRALELRRLGHELGGAPGLPLKRRLADLVKLAVRGSAEGTTGTRLGAIQRLIFLLLALFLLFFGLMPLWNALAGKHLLSSKDPGLGLLALSFLAAFLLFALALYRGDWPQTLRSAARGILYGERPRLRTRAALGILSLGAAFLLLLEVNYLSSRHYLRGDWTRVGFYSLSPEGKEIVRNLSHPLEITVFLTPESERFGDFFPDVAELISQMEAESEGVLRVEYVDPFKNRTRAQELFQKYKLPEDQELNLVVFHNPALDRTKYVYGEEMADFDYQEEIEYGGAPRVERFKGEQAFLSAVLTISEPKPKKIYLGTGHGELTVGGDRRRSLGEFVATLHDNAYEIEELPLKGISHIPQDADLLILAGPSEPFTEAEADALERFLERGGRLLLALDPLPSQELSRLQPTGLERLLGRWNIDLGEDVVFDPSPKGHLPADDSVYSYTLLLAEPSLEHPISRPLADLSVAIPSARSVSPRKSQGKIAQALLMTSPEAWGETTIQPDILPRPDPTDAQGPLSVAVASIAPGEQRGRLVVVGSSTFLLDVYLGTPGLRNAGNYNFALNTVRWLLSQDHLVEIPPKEPELIKLQLSAGSTRMVLWILMGGIPLLAVLLGSAVWQARRR